MRGNLGHHHGPVSPLTFTSSPSSSSLESGHGRPLYSSNGTTSPMDQLISQSPSYHPPHTSTAKFQHPGRGAGVTQHWNGTSRKPSSILSVAENTGRFGALLDAISASGFHDLDEMVLEYYSARFEAGSVPAMAQGASRSRRVKTMVQGLQENSQQWPRWGRRGLHEGVSQATGECNIYIHIKLGPYLDLWPLGTFARAARRHRLITSIVRLPSRTVPGGDGAAPAPHGARTASAGP